MKFKQALLMSAFIASLLAAPFSFAATYYKWVKEDGSTAFTSIPPKDRPYEKVTTLRKVGGTAPGRAAPASTRDTQQAAAEPKTLGSTTPPNKDPQRCKLAQKNLQVMSERDRIKIKGPEGETRYLSPEEIAEQKQQMQAIVDEEC